jgi:histidinol-phosphatase
MNLDLYKAFMVALAENSGDLIRPYFASQDLSVELKADDTPVTVADRAAEELMRGMIRKRFPDHGVIGEEYGRERGDAEFVWMLDPIDGTKAFATASPLFGTLIALLHNGEPVLGAIHQPVLRQLCIGDGATTDLNGKPACVRPTRPISETTFLSSSVWSVWEHQDGAAFEALTRQSRLFRTWGDCYGYLLVATGWADVMCDPIMNPWDIAPLVPIIRGAGGVITDWQGRDPVHATSTMASTSHELHGQVIAALNPGAAA